MENLTDAIVAWIEKNRGWIDCVSFHHPREGPALRESLVEALQRAMPPIDMPR